METLSILIAVVALLVALAAWWETRRQANAAEKMSQIAVEEQKANFDRWLAAEKPWVRITFPDSVPDPDYLEPDYAKYKAGAPQLICIENIGRLPCRLMSCWLENQRVKCQLVQSSVVKHRVSGSLEGSVLAQNEILTFLCPQITELAKAKKDSDGFALKVMYEYEPAMIANLEYKVSSTTPQKPDNADWVDLELVENSRMYSEDKSTQL